MTDHDTSQPSPEDPGAQAAPPPPSERPLLRRDHDKHLAGVAGGLADYLGVDAAGMRVAFVVLAIFGVGLPLYVVGWLAMPSPSMPQSYIERWFGRSPNPTAVVAIGATIILLVALNDAPDHDGIGWGIALLFGGWLLFRADSRAAVAAPPAGGAPAAPGSTWHGPGGSSSAGTTWASAPQRPRSILGRVTLGTALASLGVAALAEQLGFVTLQPAQYAALALTIVGFGLVAGAWVGRAYGLIAAGLVLIPVVLVLSLTPLPLPGGAGDVSYAPNSLEMLSDEYTLGVGELALDFSRVDFAGTSESVTVSVGLGETTIVVPDGVTVAADIEMRAGEVTLFGDRHIGRPFLDPITETSEGSADAGRLELTVDHGVGELIVRRETEDM